VNTTQNHDEHNERYDDDCEECARLIEQSALDAGIPLSVIQGKTKLTDHFSREYIDMQIKGGAK
jgi:hypothetical protein